MTAAAFAVAVLALLATPGPTNTLLAASGAAVGVRGSLRLVLAEICGYLLSILLLTGVLGGLVAAYPVVSIGLKLAASLWLTACAVRLWRQAGQGFSAAGATISMRRVFLTTLINPKAFIFALVILPRGDLLDMAPWLAAFSALVVVVATCWIGFGAMIARSAGGLVTPLRIWRSAAVVLATFASMIAGSAIAAVY